MSQQRDKKLFRALAAAFFGCVIGIASAGTPSEPTSFNLNSSDINEGQSLSTDQVFSGFGCTGNNISPSLSWTGAPESTKSFALTVYDPDAPTGSGWWHWVVFNIDSSTTSISRNAGALDSKLAPQGSVQSRTDFGLKGFGGACPPEGHGRHRYQFTLHALNVDTLQLSDDSSAALVGYMINQHRIAKTTIEAIYER